MEFFKGLIPVVWGVLEVTENDEGTEAWCGWVPSCVLVYMVVLAPEGSNSFCLSMNVFSNSA